MTLRKSLSPDVQVLLFSATFGPQTDQFATAFARVRSPRHRRRHHMHMCVQGPPGREVSRITIKKEELSLATVKQFFIVVGVATAVRLCQRACVLASRCQISTSATPC